MKNVAGIGFSLAVALLLFASASAQEFSADMISHSAEGKVTRANFTTDSG